MKRIFELNTLADKLGRVAPKVIGSVVKVVGVAASAAYDETLKQCGKRAVVVEDEAPKGRFEGDDWVWDDAPKIEGGGK